MGIRKKNLLEGHSFHPEKEKVTFGWSFLHLNSENRANGWRYGAIYSDFSIQNASFGDLDGSFSIQNHALLRIDGEMKANRSGNPSKMENGRNRWKKLHLKCKKKRTDGEEKAIRRLHGSTGRLI